MAKTQELSSSADALVMLADSLKTQATRPNILAYEPHAKQQRFHGSTKKVRLYIGGNRSGKTVGGVVEDILWATGRHPIFSKQFPPPVSGRVVTVDFLNGFEKIIEPEFKRWVPASDLRGGSWSAAFDKLERVLHFKNGSFIEFMSYDQDLDKFAGTSRHFIHFDEEPPNDIYTECLARLVDTGGMAWITMTPVEGMTWIYDVIYEPGVAGDSPRYDVIQVSMTDNPHISEVEAQAFLDSLDADEREARAHGKFVQLGGLIYKEFGDHNIIEDFIPPKDWMWAASLDHGFNNPTAWLYHAVSPDGQVITFHEHYQSGWTIDQHAKKVHEINKYFGRVPDYYIGDPSIRNTDPITGTSIHEEYANAGIPIILGNNDVDAGLVRVARYMRTEVAGRKRWVIAKGCEWTIRELRRYRWKTYANKTLMNRNNAYEVPHKKDDHACDSLRYFIMSRPDLVADSETNEHPVNPMNAPEVSAEPMKAEPNKAPDTEWRQEGDFTNWEDDMGNEW